MENFDAIGRWREQDNGLPIDSSGVLNDGTEITGLDGLREYLRREEPQFQRNLAVKLLGYALGRAEIVTDRPLISQITEDLQHEGRFSDVVVRIATSRRPRLRYLVGGRARFVAALRRFSPEAAFEPGVRRTFRLDRKS